MSVGSRLREAAGTVGNWLGISEAGGNQATQVVRATLPERRGFEFGIPDGGLDEYNSGGITGNDRRSVLTQLYESYMTCPWAWAAVNAIARTITAGGLATEFTGDDEDGDVEVPPKPPAVLAVERLLKWCNQREDMQQLLRGIIVDLLIFGDAYIEVVWLLGVPVALYSLDSPSMYPVADKHGVISGYVQITEQQQRAEFAPNEVIHISLDSPRSGIYGVSPTEAALLPITVWLFAAATIKERFRKGDPATLHVDFPAAMSPAEMTRWVAKYLSQNLGSRNIGVPVATRGGATVGELKVGQLADYLATLDQKRDEILSTYGVPPAAVGVIESGNIGGGTGEAQDKTFRVNTCQPIAALVLEKLVYALLRQGFGVEDWTLKFENVDMRDSETVEKIRDQRIRNGTWTVNRARADVGEPPVEGGDDAVIVQNTGVILVRDLEASSRAQVVAKLANTALEPDEPEDGKPLKLVKPEPEPVPEVLQPFAGQDNGQGDQLPGKVPPALAGAAAKTAKTAAAGKSKAKKDDDEDGPAESWSLVDQAKVVDEAWVKAFHRRRREALAAIESEMAA